MEPCAASRSCSRSRRRRESWSRRRGRFEWHVTEELALGSARPSDLAGALDAVFRGAERATEASGRAEIASALPRASAKVGLLLHIERLGLSRDASAATLVELSVRLSPRVHDTPARSR